MTTTTCTVCNGPMGPNSAEGYCSMTCFDKSIGARHKVRFTCMICGVHVKAGIVFCSTKCRAGHRPNRIQGEAA